MTAAQWGTELGEGHELETGHGRCGHCQVHGTISGAMERQHPYLSFLLCANVMLVLLTGQTYQKPDSRRAWEAVQGITFQGIEQG